MQLLELKLLNFRNYDELSLKFSPNRNIIYGKNGSGKTNLVEAIYVLALTQSFRGTLDNVLIKKDKNLTRINGFVKRRILEEFQLLITSDGKVAKINGKTSNKLSEYISNIHVISFIPEDLKLVSDSPKVRRNSLNIDLTQMDKSYLKILSSYNRVLKQRNTYLKEMYINANTSREYLDILTDKLIDLGMQIYQKRKKFLEELESIWKDKYYKITGIDTVNLKYISDFKEKSVVEIHKMYEKNKERDMFLGKTSLGIHHDDYLFCMNSNLMKDYASMGQQKNAVIAYKLALISMSKELNQESPILILDDLFSELDSEKINKLLNLLDSDTQTFITTTEIDKVEKQIMNQCKIFHCMDGNLEEE